MPDDTPIHDTMPLFTAATDATGQPETLVPETTPEINLGPDDTAPYGYMIDPSTGERRAKKRPGRQRRTTPTGTPATTDFTEKIERGDDRAPGVANRKTKGKKETKPAE